MLIILIFVHDRSALFTINLCRGEERDGSWDRTLFVYEVNKTHGLSESYHRQSHTLSLPLVDGNLINLSKHEFSAKLLYKNSNLLRVYKRANNTDFILFVFIIV